MRFQFIRLFFEANPNSGGGTPNPTPAPNPAPDPKPNPTPDPAKPDAAMQAKIEALEKEIAELKKPKTDPAPTPKKDEEVPEYVKKQNDLIEKLVNTVTTLQTEKTVASRKALLDAELKGVEGLPEFYRNEVIDGFEGRTFENDAAFDTYKKNKIEAAKKIAQENLSKEVSIFGAPHKSGGADSNKPSAAMEAFIKSKQPVSKN